MTLFRQEVIDAQQAQWLGTVRLHRPWSYTVVVVVALALGGSLACFVAWGEMSRKTSARGLLVPERGASSLTATQGGIVLERRVVEGQAVEQGDVLFVIDTSQRSAIGDTAGLVERHIAARQGALQSEARLLELQARHRRESLADRLTIVSRDLQYQSEEMALQERRATLAGKSLARLQQLARENFVSEAQVQIKQEEALDADARLQALKRQRLGLQLDVSAVRAELAQVDAQLQAELAKLDRGVAAVQQERVENAARQRLLITAPQAGVAAALHVQPGQSVSAGQALATVMPEHSILEAQLWLPSHQIGFIAQGQRVYLRYAAYPHQKFGLHPATVQHVPMTPTSADELPRALASQLALQTQSNEALYRVTARLDRQTLAAFGAMHQLKPGMTLEAAVIQERRAIWEWLLAPAMSVSTKLKVLGESPARSGTSG